MAQKVPARAGKMIAAAGAVVLRGKGRNRTVAMIRQDRYDSEWTLPKGKLNPGEPSPVAAVREVLEETGVTVRLGSPLDRLHYDSPKGPKVVDWWVGHVVDERPRPPDKEVDEVAFVPIAKARKRLQHQALRELLDQALDSVDTTPLLVVRHAKAVSRSDWSGSEGDRPLTSHGKRQANLLRALLAAYGITELASSPWLRCRATFTPYARKWGLTIRDIDELTEARAGAEPQAARIAVAKLRERAADKHRPTAVCIHRPTIPDVLTALDLPWQHFGTSHCAAVHLVGDGQVAAVERLRHG